LKGGGERFVFKGGKRKQPIARKEGRFNTSWRARIEKPAIRPPVGDSPVCLVRVGTEREQCTVM